MFVFSFYSGQRLATGDKYLYDGVLFGQQFSDILITPYTANKRSGRTMKDRMKDQNIRRARAVIEHYFGRMKAYFPLLRQYRFKREVAGFALRTCAMLTNIILLMQCPLRYVPCTPTSVCYVCRHMPENHLAVRLAHKMSASEHLAEVIDHSLRRHTTLQIATLVEGDEYDEMDPVDRN